MNATLNDVLKDYSGYDRAFARHRVHIATLVQPLYTETAATEAQVENAERPLSALIYNLSLSGIGIICTKYLELGVTTRVELALNNRQFSLLSTVRWRQQIERPGKPVYRYGAQFLGTKDVTDFIPAVAEFLRARAGGHPARV